jgi:hypothetical protein
MPSIPNISFSARFDLTGVPTLILTDTSTNGLTATRVAAFDITQPDLYTRTGNILSPDMAAGVTTFSIALRLDSNGLPQCGTYNIVMTVRNTGYDDTTFTRNWISQYIPVTLSITNNFDTFTPNLSVTDATNYSVSNYNSGTVTRAWNISSTATGTLTGSGITKSFIYSGNYYESNYTISLTSSLLYTHQVYSWFTINESTNKTYTACIDTPPTIVELVAAISDLKLLLDQAINTCQTYDHLKADFEFAETLLMHIIDKIRTNDMDNIYTDLTDLLMVLDNHQIPACNPTNVIIPPYDLSLYSSVLWGDIGGDIVNQTDVNLQNVTNNGSITTNTIRTGGYYLTGMTAGTGALYFNSGANRVTLANYNSNGSLVFEVNGGNYAMTINPNTTIRMWGYTSNGFLKTSGGDGTLVVDTTSYVPTTRTLTINGTAYDLSADRAWTIDSMVYPAAGIAVSTGTAWGTSIVDNSANWNDAYSYRITSATSPLSITSNVISISQSGISSSGYLSSTDWNTFNNKFDLPSLTNGSVLFSNGTTIAEDNANLFWNDTTNRLGIGLAGATSPKSTLHVGPWSVHSDLGTSSVRIGATLGGSNTVVNALHLDSDPSTLSYNQGLALTFGLHNTSFGEYTSRIVHYGYNTSVRSSRLQIQTHSATTGVWNTGMFMDDLGRVGFSTTSPANTIDVTGTARVTSTVTLSNLAGSGNRMVIASSTGVLSTQAIATGTVTSVDMSVPTGFAISGNPVTSTGTLALAYASGYSLPTNVKQSNWDDAYTWVSNFPSQTGNSGKYLTTDGSNLSWGDSIPGFEANFLLMGA